ncbi:MAG: UDP-N-acetylglucosamine 1-carboxyvinyltransferase [Clostridiales bacterium]|nr:UDP-N-acetylglucosamine 1-carboxyvinyltransferase [Clostridiales bacterium]
MEKIVINGGAPLRGSVDVSGSKNAALPIIYACILVKGKCIIENIPNIIDINRSFDILRGMGAVIRTVNKTTVEIDCTNVVCGTSDYNLVRRLRGSYYLLGAELGRFGKARVAYPGGCDFGVRPIDQHIKGFKALGGEVITDGGYIEISTKDNKITPANIYFDMSTVGATLNIMIASAISDGVTVIENAAREPHIVDCANFLNSCGANISGAGSDVIKIKGVQSLHGCTYAIIPDMIEAGSFMVAAAATRGHVRINNVIPKHLESITAKLEEVGAVVEEFDDSVEVIANRPLKPTNVKTLPYPGFPTDMHPQMCALLATIEGISFINESIYDNRFKYIEELKRMGADIKVDGRIVTITGGVPLSAAPLIAVDLRGGIAVLTAALTCEGVSEISEINLIERGYDDIVGKLKGLGADIKKICAPDPVALKKAN